LFKVGNLQAVRQTTLKFQVFKVLATIQLVISGTTHQFTSSSNTLTTLSTFSRLCTCLSTPLFSQLLSWSALITLSGTKARQCLLLSSSSQIKSLESFNATCIMTPSSRFMLSCLYSAFKPINHFWLLFS